MKKIIFIAIAILFTAVAFGQKVKVKDNQILIDKTPIVKFIELKPDLYRVENLNNTDNAFTVKLAYEVIGDRYTDFWLEFLQEGIETPNTENVVRHKLLQSNEKMVANNLLLDLRFINQDGIDAEEIQNYFKQTHTREIPAEVIKAKKEVEFLESINASIDNEDYLYIDGRKMGYLITKGDTINFYSLKGEEPSADDSLIAVYSKTGISYKLVIPNTNKSKILNITSLTTQKKAKQKIYEEVILLRNEIIEDDPFTPEEVTVEHTNTAKKGYVIVGKKKEKFSGEFDLKNGRIFDGGSTATVVWFTQKEKKDGTFVDVRHQKTANPSQNERVCTDSGTCYLGVRANGNPYQGIIRIGPGSNKPTARFYEIIEETSNYIILKDVDTGNFVLTPNDDSEGVYFGNQSPKKLAKIVKESLKCKKVNMLDYNTSTLEGVKQFAEYYSRKCKK